MAVAFDRGLPAGLALRGAMITGTPEELGPFHFRLQAINNCCMEERDFLLQVTGRPILRVAPEHINLDPAGHGYLARLRYSVNQTSTPWLRFRQASGTTPLPNAAFAGDALTLQITPEKLDPATCYATLSFCGPSGAAPLSVPVHLRVIAPVPH